MIKAKWGLEYDYHNDKCYNEPQHEECGAPIYFEEGAYRCICCGEEMELTDDMKKWIDERSGEKEECIPCMNCGKPTMKVHYYKNRNTLEWETGCGECDSCGMRFIV